MGLRLCIEGLCAEEALACCCMMCMDQQMNEGGSYHNRHHNRHHGSRDQQNYGGGYIGGAEGGYGDSYGNPYGASTSNQNVFSSTSIPYAEPEPVDQYVSIMSGDRKFSPLLI